jgi:hypothetical protein
MVARPLPSFDTLRWMVSQQTARKPESWDGTDEVGYLVRYPMVFSDGHDGGVWKARTVWQSCSYCML